MNTVNCKSYLDFTKAYYYFIRYISDSWDTQLNLFGLSYQNNMTPLY